MYKLYASYSHQIHEQNIFRLKVLQLPLDMYRERVEKIVVAV